MKHPVLDLYESLKPFLDKKVKLMYYSEDKNEYFEEKPENIKVTPVIWILLDDSEEPDVIEISWDPIEWEFKVSLGQDPDLSIDYYIPNVKPNLFAEVMEIWNKIGRIIESKNKEMKSKERYFSVNEVSKLTRISKQTLNKWVKEGVIPCKGNLIPERFLLLLKELKERDYSTRFISKLLKNSGVTEGGKPE